MSDINEKEVDGWYDGTGLRKYDPITYPNHTVCHETNERIYFVCDSNVIPAYWIRQIYDKVNHRFIDASDGESFRAICRQDQCLEERSGSFYFVGEN